MSYCLDLDEYTDEQLHAELERRLAKRLDGLCSYCDKPLGPERVCKQHEYDPREVGDWIAVKRVDRRPLTKLEASES